MIDKSSPGAIRPQCCAAVYVRDQLRHRKGRGFVMHYDRRQCLRVATAGPYCRQHAKVAVGRVLLDYESRR
jgi:hypothetical protein